MTALTILSTQIRQLDDLYSLNDLHKAAGGEHKHKPANFMRNEQTQELIAELSCENSHSLTKTSCSDLSIITTKTVTGKGKQQGTYVCRELVFAYAMWISAKFHLQVIRAFDALHSQSAKLTQAKSKPKRYNYPRHLLEQEHFISPTRPARLSISMLGDEKEFSSTLLELLLELGIDGHNVDAPYAEYIAMREGLIKARRALDEIMETALRANVKPASTAKD